MIVVFWVMIPYVLVGGYQIVGGRYHHLHEREQNRLLKYIIWYCV
jgi:hypothetical protein